MNKAIFPVVILLLLSNILFGQLKHIKMPNEEGLVDVNIINQNTFIIAEKWAKKIYTTKDEGDTWTYKTVNTIYPGSNDAISFINENIGYVQTTELVNGGVYSGGTEVSNLYKTTDGGDSWRIITPGNLDPETTSFKMGTMFFFSETIGMANVAGVLWRTTNGGDSWSEIGKFPNNCAFDYNKTGTAYFTEKYLFSANETEIYYTNDFGASWDMIHVAEVHTNLTTSLVTLNENDAHVIFNKKMVILNDGVVQNTYELPFYPFVFVGGENQTMIEATLTSVNPPAIKIEQWNTSDYGANSTLVDALEDGYTYMMTSDFDFNKGVMVGTQGDVIIFKNPETYNAALYPNNSEELIIYPNPVPKGQTISIIGDIQIGTSWNVRNSMGKIIQTGIVENNNLNTLRLDASGIYLLEIYNGNEQIIKKFIVQ